MRKKLLATIIGMTILCPVLSGVASGGMAEALYERWSGGGAADPMLTESSTPDYTEILTETQWGVGDDNGVNNYQARITTWIVPPVTGNYTFWIVTDDNGRLWLSSDDQPANASLIATETGWAGEGGWGAVGDEARSAEIPLVGGRAYWLRGGYQEGGGGDHIRVAWSSPEAGIAEHTIIDGAYLAGYTNPIRADGPEPGDGAINVKVEDVQLSWIAPALLPETPYTVYFGTDPNAKTLLAENLTDPTIGVGTLSTDATYYWHVDVEGVDANGLPTVNAGLVWSFTTTPATPVIFAQPVKTEVYAGETAEFVIDVYSANAAALSYAWFKEGGAEVLSTGNSLSIEDAQVADEGIYYCELSNASGTVTSDLVSLNIKELVSHWPLDEDFEDKIGGRHGVPVGDPLPVIDTEEKIDGAGSAKFTIGGAAPQTVRIPTAGLPTGSSMTISFWEKTPADGPANGYMLASSDGDGDGRIGYEYLYMWRRGGAVHYLGLYVGRGFSTGNSASGNLGGIAREEWHMCTLVYNYDVPSWQYYVDGEFRYDYGQMALRFEGFVDDLLIANRHNMARAFMGNIDDLRIYDFAMSPVEIATLYTDSVGGYVCLNPVPYDLNNDCILDIGDLAVLADNWLECNLVPATACQ